MSAAKAKKLPVFKGGFMGASTDEATRYIASVTPPDAKNVLVPFAGSGKDVAAIAQSAPGCDIYSWDVQVLSAYNIQGVFARPAPLRKIERPILTPGKSAPINGDWPADAIGLWNGLARNGTAFEKAALVRATVRCSFQGKLSAWRRGYTAHNLWAEFQAACVYLEQWCSMPARFIHTTGSFYDDPASAASKEPWDFVQVDPPKVITKRDVYSGNSGFAKLNAALGGPPIPEWNADNALHRLRSVMELQWQRLAFMYATGLRPDEDDIQEAIHKHAGSGATINVKEFGHGARTDIVWVIDRRVEPRMSMIDALNVERDDDGKPVEQP